MTPSEITDRLQSELPLTRAMGMSVVSWDGAVVTLVAPLQPNLNHADTAFGGSISCMGILAGYALVYLLFQERGISTRVVIQKSTTDYLRPIDTEITSTASLPNPAAIEEFLEMLKQKRRARLTLNSQVLSGKTLAATHTGIYVALLY